MKTDGLLEDIKSKIDIVEFISDYLNLKQAGQNWKALCPFHPEKTPSFMVNTSRQIYHCFGCGAGGDVFSFIMKYDNLSFNEAKTLLAKKAGITLPTGNVNRKALQKNEQIRKAYDEALKYYVTQLNESANAREYVSSRGISRESLELFRIGYAPPGWNNLLNRLRRAGFTDSVIREAGLAVSGNKGLYDMFRERIIFPIMSMSGQVVAFGGRALDNAMPKYINSPESALFKKSDTLFGLHTAREEIRKLNSAVLVEGYTDVIICHQYGFKNAVAPLGTSLTSGHLRKLRRITNNIVVVFDGDNAGIAAARRAIHSACRDDFRVKVLLLPENEDPDSYLRVHGSGSFASAIEHSQSMIDFMFNTSRAAINETAREILIILADIRDVLLAEELILDLCHKTGFNEEKIRGEFKNLRKKAAKNKLRHQNPEIANINREELLLLSALISFPEKTEYVLGRIGLNDIHDKTVSSLLAKIASVKGKNDLSIILETTDEAERELFSRLSVKPGFDTDYVDKNIDDCLKRIERRKLEEKMALAERSGDVSLSNALLIEKKKLIKEKGL